jgi:hypothetical protein
MDAVHVGDMDTAYAELLSTEDAELLVKLMEQTGPVVDQLSNEAANEVLNAVGQFLVEESLYDIALSWLQQVCYCIQFSIYSEGTEICWLIFRETSTLNFLIQLLNTSHV